eukprot:s344_g7.t1
MLQTFVLQMPLCIVFLWTTLTVQHCDFTFWGSQCGKLRRFLEQDRSDPADLSQEVWFCDILRCWGRLAHTVELGQITQQDSAEFVQTWLALLETPAFNMRWHKRLEESESIRNFDVGAPYMPIILKFDDALAACHSCDLSQLFLIWRQDDGMCRALTDTPPCLCIQLDRSVQDQAGDVSKTDCLIRLDATCLVPVFASDDLRIELAEYDIIAATAHFGIDGAGHYRAAMRMAPSLITLTAPAEWLITQDWEPPTPMWTVPSWFNRNISSG